MVHLIILATLFSSCGVSEEKKNERKEFERKQLFTSISKQFDALIFPDTVYSPTTLYFQNVIRKGNKHIITDFFFDDVERKDSGYLVSVHSGFIHPKYFELICTENIFKKLFPKFPEINPPFNRYANDNVFLIVNLLTLRKTKLSEVENRNPYDLVSDSFIFKGELIDFYLSK